MLSQEEIKKLTDITMPEDTGFERVSFRGMKRIEIVEPDPAWPAQYAELAERIHAALGPAALLVQHVGSTSVAGLPAKAVIDIDVAVADPTNEATYVPALEAAGFQFLHREPLWFQHRFFGLKEPYTNLHVFSADAPELKRHTMFRDYLIGHPEERDIYAAAKRKAAVEADAAGENVDQYNVRKKEVLHGILRRMFASHGLKLDDGPLAQ